MKEIRVADIHAEKRSEDSGEMVLVGYPIKFNEETTINYPGGSYKEIIKRTALDNTDLSDSRLLINHDTKRIPLARTGKTMSLSVDEEGLFMRAILNPESEEARSAYTAVERGDLDRMSFAFKIAEDGDSFNAETRTREIHNILRIHEVSLVSFPAYEGTTVSVEARDRIQGIEQRAEEVEALKIKLNKILYKGDV